MEDVAERPDFPDVCSCLDAMLNQGGETYTREYLPVFDGISLSASESSSAQEEDGVAEESVRDLKVAVADVHVDALDENSNDIISQSKPSKNSCAETVSEAIKTRGSKTFS